MTSRTAGLLGVLLIIHLALPVVAQEKKPRVTAKEPTVVTVEGKADEVRPDDSERQTRSRSAVGGIRAVGRGAAWVGKRFADWLDFNWGGDNVVPSERERREKADRESRR